jgi:DNA-binding NtrC family response regulator
VEGSPRLSGAGKIIALSEGEKEHVVLFYFAPSKWRLMMTKSILDGKKLLVVDDEPDILTVLEEEIMDACPHCVVEKAATFEETLECMNSTDYDLVILDIMGVRGFELLERAIKKKLKVIMLTAHALNPQALKRSYEMGARAYLPKDKIGEIVPFLEDALAYEFEPGWKRLYKSLKGYFDDIFGTDWEKLTGIPWNKWGEQ